MQLPKDSDDEVNELEAVIFNNCFFPSAQAISKVINLIC
jgi:hypothetical protein